MTHKQNINFWNSTESLSRYGDMDFKLHDIEALFIMDAARLLAKPVSEIKVLDLGCGGGRTTVPLHNMGFDVVGVDIAEVLIEDLKKKFSYLEAEVGDAADLHFANGSFDIVLFSHNSLDCLYPYEMRLNALKEINRVLKQPGFYIFSSHVFNLAVYNRLTLSNIIRNLARIPRILVKGGFYKEKMNNGDLVDLYASNLHNVKNELGKVGFNVIRSSRTVNFENNAAYTFAKNIISWERYFLVGKGHVN